MGFFSEDMAPMLGVFEAETSELMGSVNRIIVRAEHDGAFTPEDVAELFRSVHTIKGSSGMMGLETLSLLSHKIEDLFDIIRSDPSCAEGHIADIIDHLYAYSDYVGDELERMGDDDYVPADPGNLIDGIAKDVALLSGPGDAVGAGESATTASGGQGDGAGVDEPSEGAPGAGDLTGCIVLRVSFKPDVAMVNARAMVIMRQLGAQVEVKSHEPADLTDSGAAKAIVENGLLVTVSEADVEAAKAFLAKSSFISRIVVLDESSSAPAAPTAEQQRQVADSVQSSEKFVTLRWSSVHALQDMAGEFLLQTSKLKALANASSDENGLRTAVSQAARLVDELVYRINAMAMVSMSAMVPQLSRMVRDMSRESGKQVSFEVSGGDIEIDRNLYNSISDPLVHIIRNAVDHGIEPSEERLVAGKEARGKVTLTIENLGARVAFRVADDGRGIDVDKVLEKAQANGSLQKPVDQYTREEVLQMVMTAGLSTAKEVTQYSGRGVGMDVVSQVLRDFDGQINIESEPGRGTSMTLLMPVSVTSVESLVFRIGEFTCHMPLFNLNKIYVAAEAGERLSQFEDSVLFEFAKRQLPVIDMHRLLGCSGENAFIIVCHSMDDEFAISVDEVLGEFACSNKPLPACLGREWQDASPIRNAAILDDGSVGYALNAATLASVAQDSERAYARAAQFRAEIDYPADFELATASDVPESVFIFELGADRYAVPVEWVEQLVPMSACAETPHALPYLMGIVNYRNHALAVFDLAKSAGVDGECPYVLVVNHGDGDLVGLSISSAAGVRNLHDAVLAEDQPELRAFAAGYRSFASLIVDVKEPPVTLLTKD